MCGENGELTSPVYYRGQQWAATGHGIEGLDKFGYYNIPASDLWRIDWADHMSSKRDIDLKDFQRALNTARHVNSKQV